MSDAKVVIDESIDLALARARELRCSIVGGGRRRKRDC
jgi:hypothetical protein